MYDHWIFWIIAVFAAVTVGLGKGGLPVIASLAVPSLSLFMSPIAAAGLLLPVYIVSDIFALFFYRKDFNVKVLKISILGMTIGVLIGWATANIVIEWVVTLIIGFMGVIFAVNQLSKNSKKKTNLIKVNQKKGIFWCSVAGFTSFISHNGGPPWQIFVLPLGLSKVVYVGTSVIAFSYVNAIKVIPYFFLGQLNFQSIKIALFLLIPASLAVYIGYLAIKIIPERIFYLLVSWALLIISFKLIWDGLILSKLFSF